MANRGMWPLLVVAAAVAAYLVGARSGQRPGTRTDGRPRLVEAPATLPAEEHATAPMPVEQEVAPAEPPPPTEAPAARADAVPSIPLEEPPTPRDPVHAGSPFDARLRDDLDRGGPMSLLRALSPRGRRPWSIPEADGAAALVGDDTTFPKIFSRQTSGPVVNGPGADWSTLADGTILLYPEGVFTIDWTEAPERFPRDLVLKGAGMDRTLLRVRRAQRGENEEIHGLTLASVTIDCGNDDLLRLKSGLAAVRLVECRVVRADSILDGADAGAIRAQRCEFEGGRLSGGEHPRCKLLGTERGLARLDDCAIRGTIDVCDSGHVAGLFRRCAFVQVHQNLQSNLEGRPGVRLEECRFEIVDNPPPPRPLHAINPAWRD